LAVNKMSNNNPGKLANARLVKFQMLQICEEKNYTKQISLDPIYKFDITIIYLFLL